MNNIEQIEKDIYKYTLGKEKVECTYIKECNYSKEKGYCIACINYKASIKELATALHKAGYHKRSETVKEFAEKIKASPNRDYSHSYQLGLLGLTENDINDLAEQFGKEE